MITKRRQVITKLPGGATAIVCFRGRRPASQCVSCGRPAGLLCDFPVERNGKPATCDRATCAKCALHVRTEFDLCATHASADYWDRAAGRPLVGPGAAPKGGE